VRSDDGEVRKVTATGKAMRASPPNPKIEQSMLIIFEKQPLPGLPAVAQAKAGAGRKHGNPNGV